jgi:ubiquinone/menaquinone biosynthesis C-methylase UbiE
MSEAIRDKRGQFYDRYFGHVSREFIPPLLRAARLRPGQRVLDVATGTGLVAEAASAIVGTSGSVVAVDIAPAMVEHARERLRHVPNISFEVEDGQSLTLPAQSFDAVICGLALMFFPDPGLGLREFHRVLRPGGRLAVSVNTSAERSYNNRINLAVGHYLPEVAEIGKRTFAIGDASVLSALLREANFTEIETFTETRHFTCPSFEAYFEEVEAGSGTFGRAYLTLPEDQRRAIREEVRRDVGGGNGQVEIDVELRIAGCSR